jgi:hypothetical protein
MMKAFSVVTMVASLTCVVLTGCSGVGTVNIPVTVSITLPL